MARLARTLIAICGRDRRVLVEQCLESVGDAVEGRGDLHVSFHLDPLCQQYDERWLQDRGCAEVVALPLDPAAHARDRVSAMRCHAALHAVEQGFDRVAFLDSDVRIDPGYFARLDELWCAPAPEWGAVALGNYAGYQVPGYFVQMVPHLGASIRTHGLGGCLSFRADQRLHDAAKAGVPHGGSWDTYFCKAVAQSRVLTSDTSYARHLGRYSGLCAVGHYGLDWHRFTPFLERAG